MSYSLMVEHGPTKSGQASGAAKNSSTLSDSDSQKLDVLAREDWNFGMRLVQLERKCSTQ
jgi:hypothetical protein